MHQQVTQLIYCWPSWVATISVAKNNFGRITGKNTHKIHGIKQIITFRGGRIESFHRSRFAVVAALVPPAQQVVKKPSVY